MPSQSLDVDRESVRMLVAEVGYTKASIETGIKRDTLYKWGKRKGWNEPIHHAKSKTVQYVQSPADVLQSEIEANGHETRLKLSRYAKRQAETLARNGNLRHTREFKDIAQGANILHGYNEAKNGQSFTLNVLNMGDLALRIGQGKSSGDQGVSE